MDELVRVEEHYLHHCVFPWMECWAERLLNSFNTFPTSYPISGTPTTVLSLIGCEREFLSLLSVPQYSVFEDPAPSGGL